MSINPDTLTILDRYRQAATALTDDHVRVFTEAWVNAWNEVADEFQRALDDLLRDGVPSPGALRRSRRLAQALDAIGAELDDLARRAGVVIVGSLPTAMELAGSTNAALLTSQLPRSAQGFGLVVGWDRVDRGAVSAIIRRSTERIHASTLPLADDAVAAMRVNLIRGVAAGDNPVTVGRRMLRDTETVFNGGLPRAIRISRTEMLDAMREGARLVDEANRDVVTGWVWTATLGADTCPACWSMHGQVFPPDSPGPYGHPNCRCTRVPKLKDWDDLGFTGLVEPPDLLPDAEATFDALPPNVQLRILGPARFDAWRRGDYPMDRWAVLRQNPEWRPSFQVAPLPSR